MYKIDDVEYDVALIGLTRNFNALDREETGRSTTTGSMVRSVFGSFFSYDVSINSRRLSQEQYDELYAVLTSPDEFHNFELPFGQEEYDFFGYVSTAQDTLKRIDRNTGKRYFGNLSFTITPKKRKA